MLAFGRLLGLAVGGIHQGCTLSMCFLTVVFYVRSRSFLESRLAVVPQLVADSLKCTRTDRADLLLAAQVTAGFASQVGQKSLFPRASCLVVPRSSGVV